MVVAGVTNLNKLFLQTQTNTLPNTFLNVAEFYSNKTTMFVSWISNDIFLFPRFYNKTKEGVVLRHSTRIVLKIW